MEYMTTAEDAREVSALFRGEGLQAHALVLPHPRRPVAFADERRHGAVQALFPAAEAPGGALHRHHHGAEVRAHQRHRHHRYHRSAPKLLRDARQLQLRRVLQGRDVRLGYRVLHPGAGAAHGAAVLHRLRGRRRDHRDLEAPGRCRKATSRSWGRTTTSGAPAPPVPAAPARRSTSTRARSSAAEAPTAPRVATATVSWSTGTACSHSTTARRTARLRPFRRRTSTPAWDSSASRRHHAGSAVQLRDRRAAQPGGRGREADRTRVRRRSRRRPVAAHHGRPQPCGHLHAGRRHPALQRGSRLRAAPPAAPRGHEGAPAGRWTSRS